MVILKYNDSLVSWHKMSITQESDIGLSYVTCLCIWHECSIFLTIQVCHKLFASVLSNYWIFFCTITLILLTMCLTLVSGNISSNMTFMIVVIFDKISWDPMDLSFVHRWQTWHMITMFIKNGMYVWFFNFYIIPRPVYVCMQCMFILSVIWMFSNFFAVPLCIGSFFSNRDLVKVGVGFVALQQVSLSTSEVHHYIWR